MAAGFAARVLDSDAHDPVDAGAVQVSHRRYMLAHRRDEKTATMLAHMFGAAWTTRFVDDVLYPVA